MKTQVIQVNSTTPEEDVIAFAANAILQGKLVAFPTETVYGLGANALDSNAVAKIFAAKNRPADNPVIVHLASSKDLQIYAKHIPQIAWTLTEKFWPGPLTLLLEKQENIPSIVTAGSYLISLRMPNHPIALALISAARVPIAAPSANISGRPSPTNATHVLEDLDGKVDIILDGGISSIGVESTVLDITSTPPMILRPGGVSLEMLEKIIPGVVYYETTDEKPRAPGMKYTHYSPHATILLYIGNSVDIEKNILKDFNDSETEVISDTLITGIPQEKQHILASPEEYAAQLFSLFRVADAKGITTILVKGIEEKHLGKAVMNRLKKAAKNIIISQ